MNWKVTEIIKKLWMPHFKVLPQRFVCNYWQKPFKKAWVQAMLPISNFKPSALNS